MRNEAIPHPELETVEDVTPPQPKPEATVLDALLQAVSQAEHQAWMIGVTVPTSHYLSHEIREYAEILNIVLKGKLEELEDMQERLRLHKVSLRNRRANQAK